MIKVFSSIKELSHFAAEKFIATGNEAIKKNDIFSVALAGGSTPKLLYKLLASDEFRSKLDWSKVFFFFGDDRYVLPDDSESNFRMANENLFIPLQISEKNIFRWITEAENTEIIADDYESWIWSFFTEKGLPTEEHGDDEPSFDLILLGMGDDAHTASLFPFTKALKETEKLAAANFVEKFDAYRFTLTFPVINSAANIIFLVSGENKAEALREVLQGEFKPDKFPAQNVKPEKGNLLWLVDKAAAKLLDS